MPLVALLLATTAIAADVVLNSRANSSRSAQIEVIQLTNALNELRGVPWEAGRKSHGSAAPVHARLVAEELRITSMFDDLRRSHVPTGNLQEDLDALEPMVRANFDSAGAIYAYVTSGEPQTTAGIGRLAAEGEAASAPARTLLEDISGDYAKHAQVAEGVSHACSIGSVVVLLATFWFLYRRAARVTKGKQQALGALQKTERERKRLLERTIEVAEHERVRLAADIHDGPIQQLAAIHFNVELVSLLVERGQYDRARPLLAQVRDDVVYEIGSLRRLMTGLRDPVLDQGGISAALRDCAAELFDPQSTSCEIRGTAIEPRPAPEIETAIYRVAREALVNVRKHAQATHVEVTVERDGETLHLIVVDDGKGFAESDGSEAERNGHFGLLGMRERIETLGGAWRVSSTLGAGTRIEATLPWNEDESVFSTSVRSAAPAA